MLKIGLLIILMSAIVYVSVGQHVEYEAKSSAGDSSSGDVIRELSHNDQMVLHAIRTIHSAQLTYFQTFGNGNFASMPALQYQGLVDESLGSGYKHGYKFLVRSTLPTPTSLSRFELTATPTERDQLSFYMTESCEIRGGYKNGSVATISDPVLEACGANLGRWIEKRIITEFRSIHRAQIVYQNTSGMGNFGTLIQLYNAGLLPPSGFAFTYFAGGYVGTLTLISAGPSSPATYTFNAVPVEYRRAGVRSFYIDQTGILRGGDKNGAPANQHDPPIVD